MSTPTPTEMREMRAKAWGLFANAGDLQQILAKEQADGE